MHGLRTGPAVLILLLGILLGLLGFGAVRLAALPEKEVTHYHANWLLMLEGEPLNLSQKRYMEDVASCKVDPTQVAPEDRVHLHNLKGEVVHVHDTGATWGHLMANLGFGLGDDYLVLEDGVHYRSGEGKTLKFILNGKPVRSIANRVIESRDRLLISYGPESAEEVSRTQFPSVANSAGHHNTQPDPAGCSGAEHEGPGDRLRRAFWF